jgi:hypothetical protein
MYFLSGEPMHYLSGVDTFMLARSGDMLDDYDE